MRGCSPNVCLLGKADIHNRAASTTLVAYDPNRSKTLNGALQVHEQTSFGCQDLRSRSHFAPRSQDASSNRENAETGHAEQRRAREFQASIKLLYREHRDWPERTHDIYGQRRCSRDAELEREARDGHECESRKGEKRQRCKRWSRQRVPYCRLDGSREAKRKQTPRTGHGI